MEQRSRKNRLNNKYKTVGPKVGGVEPGGGEGFGFFQLSKLRTTTAITCPDELDGGFYSIMTPTAPPSVHD